MFLERFFLFEQFPTDPTLEGGGVCLQLVSPVVLQGLELTTTHVTGALDMGVLLRVLYKMTPENRGNMVYDH